jgi:tRNA nucleotidyltransferase (CCA-adding enzyme)
MIDSSKKKLLHNILAHYHFVSKIVDTIYQQGGKALLVGGAVRDLLLGLDVKDLDIEVYQLTTEQLEKILKAFGPVSLVGKSFGVLRLHGLDIDWSLPRADSAGRKPHVVIDPDMSFAQSFRRRDLTINAMGIDLHTFELIDPFDGQEDLKNKILRAPDIRLFEEDPLRFFRVMQFIGRFEMEPDASLNVLCAHMDVSQVSVERIEAEFEKLLFKSVFPSRGIRWVRQLGRLQEILPEVAATIGIEQNPAWHPEGDVFEHTMQALDAAAVIPYADKKTKLIVLYAALCHDLGKAVTTEDREGVLKSPLHAHAGVPIAKRLLKRITRNKELIDPVCKMVNYHMEPLQFIKGCAKMAAYKRLANKLAPDVTINMLADLAVADRRGRNGTAHTPLTDAQPDVELFRQRAAQAEVLEAQEKPILQGKDIIDSVAPGPQMGKILDKAYEIQIEEGIKDKAELKQRVLK